MYHLNADVNFEDLFNCVRKCSSDVFFRTQDGDNLNLKSELSHYFFMIIANNNNFILKGHIHCEDTADYDILKDFITAC